MVPIKVKEQYKIQNHPICLPKQSSAQMGDAIDQIQTIGWHVMPFLPPMVSPCSLCSVLGNLILLCLHSVHKGHWSPVSYLMSTEISRPPGAGECKTPITYSKSYDVCALVVEFSLYFVCFINLHYISVTRTVYIHNFQGWFTCALTQL